MARKTREEAELTRHLLLDTAERVFHEQGVAATSLAEIAAAAGLTRGAIYWHFANKLDLFTAICDRIKPELQAMEVALHDRRYTPAARLWRHALALFDLVHNNERMRRICAIHHIGCEQVGEMAPLLLEQISWNLEKQAKLQQVLEEAAAAGQLRAGVQPQLAALGLHSLYGGLCHSWMINIEDNTVQQHITKLLSPYFVGIFQDNCWLDAPAGND
ncbi:TetR family transcriptional regulator [Vogesella sp. LIG4]|uniref:TetR family transcriptional regulator n=1 Tax=Vogesella sp. LIG4 TaxID=1192162 RepID=UPI00081FDD1B|nr:TetR family transcriptional regulator [Vogesella sp. LIG4]SCK17095.1 transcriptional regulator, TetR family [Vogesella sp. LIG4]